MYLVLLVFGIALIIFALPGLGVRPSVVSMSTSSENQEIQSQSAIEARSELNGVTLTCTAAVRGNELAVSYTVTNTSDADIYVMDASPAVEESTRKAYANHDDAIIWLGESSVAHILKGIGELPAMRGVLVRVIPLAAKLAPGYSLERSLKIPLPLHEQGPYNSVAVEHAAKQQVSTSLQFHVDFLRSTVDGFAAEQRDYAPDLYVVKGKYTVGQIERLSCALPPLAPVILTRDDDFPRS